MDRIEPFDWNEQIKGIEKIRPVKIEGVQFQKEQESQQVKGKICNNVIPARATKEEIGDVFGRDSPDPLASARGQPIAARSPTRIGLGFR